MSRLSPHDTHHNTRSLPDSTFDTGEVIAFGEFLRTAREQRGITLDQICRETKIPRRHLEALEHGQLAAVPGGTYRRGEIVAYAKVVGLDRNVALDRLEKASETFERRAPEITPPARPQIGSRFLVVLLASAALFSLLTWNRGAADAPGGQGVTDRTSTTPAPGGPTPIEARKQDADAPATRVSTESAALNTAPRLRADSPATPLPPPPPATTAGSESGFVIVSTPPGARVTVDGIGWGSTPLTIRNLPPGVKQIRLTKPGYASATRAVRLAEGQKTSVSVTLQPTNTTPPGR